MSRKVRLWITVTWLTAEKIAIREIENKREKWDWKYGLLGYNRDCEQEEW